MPYVLAIEPDARQATALKRLVREQVRADFLLAESRDAALAAINARVPDLLLVTALLSPRDEAEITEHLKTLDGASHLQTLTIPLLAIGQPKEHLRGRMIDKIKRRKTAATDGCDPRVFGDEIATYLQRALELKAEQAQREADQRETLAATASAPTPQEPVSALAEHPPIDQADEPQPIDEPDLRALAEQALAALAEGAAPFAEPAPAPIEEHAVAPFGAAHALTEAETRAPIEAQIEEQPAVQAVEEIAPVPALADVAGDAIEPAAEPAPAESIEPETLAAAQEIAATEAAPVAEPIAATEATSEPPEREAPADAARPVPLLDQARVLRVLSPLGPFLSQGSAWRSRASRRCLPERSVVEASDTAGATTLVLTPSGVAVAVRVTPPKPPAPSPWDDLFAALRQQFDRRDADWTDLTSLLGAEDDGAGDPTATEKPPHSAVDQTNPTADGRHAPPRPTAEVMRAGPPPAPVPDASRAPERADRRRKRRHRTRRRTPAEALPPIPGVDSLWVANAIAALRVDIDRLRQQATAHVAANDNGGRAAPAAAHRAVATSGDDHRPRSIDHGQPTDRPPQDEWGIHDPEKCGMAALLARLGNSQDEEPPRPRSAPRVAGEPAVKRVSAREQPLRQPRDQPASPRRAVPLSMWARSVSADGEMQRSTPVAEPLAYLPALMSGLRLPDHVAAVRYGSGCRIRRVHVPKIDRPPDADRQVVIVSRKKAEER